jgi:hypothetical protein
MPPVLGFDSQESTRIVSLEGTSDGNRSHQFEVRLSYHVRVYPVESDPNGHPLHSDSQAVALAASYEVLEGFDAVKFFNNQTINETREAARTMIRAFIRGRIVRSRYTQFAALLRPALRRQADAATHIAAIFRGFVARRRLALRRQADAATHIAAIFRGFVARRRLALRRQADAATHIAAIFRGFVARRRLLLLEALRIEEEERVEAEARRMEEERLEAEALRIEEEEEWYRRQLQEEEEFALMEAEAHRIDEEERLQAEAHRMEQERLEAEALRIEEEEQWDRRQLQEEEEFALMEAEARRMEEERLEAEAVSRRIEEERLEAEAEARRIEEQQAEARRLEEERAEARLMEEQQAEARIEEQQAEARRLEEERAEARLMEEQQAEARQLEEERAEARRMEEQQAAARRTEDQQAEARRMEEQHAAALRLEEEQRSGAAEALANLRQQQLGDEDHLRTGNADSDDDDDTTVTEPVSKPRPDDDESTAARNNTDDDEPPEAGKNTLRRSKRIQKKEQTPRCRSNRRSERIQKKQQDKKTNESNDRKRPAAEQLSPRHSKRTKKPSEKSSMKDIFGELFSPQSVLSAEEAQALLDRLPQDMSKDWLEIKIDDIIALKDRLDDATNEVNDLQRLLNHIITKQSNSCKLQPKEEQLLDTLFQTHDPESENLKDGMFYVTCSFIKRCIETGRIFEAPPPSSGKQLSVSQRYGKVCHPNSRVDLPYLIENHTDYEKYLARDNKPSPGKIVDDVAFTTAVGAQAVMFTQLVRKDPMTMVRLVALMKPVPSLILAGYNTAQTRRILKRHHAAPNRGLRDLISYEELAHNTMAMIEAYKSRVKGNGKSTMLTNADAMAHYSNRYVATSDIEEGVCDDDINNKEEGTTIGEEVDEQHRNELQLNRNRSGFSHLIHDGKDKRRNGARMSLPMSSQRKVSISPVLSKNGDLRTVVTVEWDGRTLKDIMSQKSFVKQQIHNRHFLRFPYKDKTMESLFHYVADDGQRCCPSRMQNFETEKLISDLNLETCKTGGDQMKALFSAPELSTAIIMKVGSGTDQFGVDPFYYKRLINPPAQGGGTPTYVVVSAKKNGQAANLLSQMMGDNRITALFVEKDDDPGKAVFLGYGEVDPLDTSITRFSDVLVGNDPDRLSQLHRRNESIQFFNFAFLSYEFLELLPYPIEGSTSQDVRYRDYQTERQLEVPPKLYFLVPNSQLQENGGDICTSNKLSEVAMTENQFKRAFYACFFDSSLEHIDLSDESDIDLNIEMKDLQRK